MGAFAVGAFAVGAFAVGAWQMEGHCDVGMTVQVVLHHGCAVLCRRMHAVGV